MNVTAHANRTFYIHDSTITALCKQVPAPCQTARTAAATASVACLQAPDALQHHGSVPNQRGYKPQTDSTSIAEPVGGSSRRGAFAGLVTAVVLLGLHSATVPSAAAKDSRTSVAGENLGRISNDEIDKKRRKANFKRAHDGHVAILNKYTKQWTDVKCDLQVPGLLLLREETGQVYFLGYAGLKQVDLSDDQVVAAVAADDWENNMKLVQAQAPDGTIEALELTREGFYQLVSLVSGDEDSAARMAAAAATRPADKRR